MAVVVAPKARRTLESGKTSASEMAALVLVKLRPLKVAIYEDVSVAVQVVVEHHRAPGSHALRRDTHHVCDVAESRWPPAPTRGLSVRRCGFERWIAARCGEDDREEQYQGSPPRWA